MTTVFKDDEDTTLNKMIKAAYKIANASGTEIPKEFITTLREIYNLGFEDGQNFVWSLRSGKGKMVNLNGEEIDVPTPYSWAVDHTLNLPKITRVPHNRRKK
jgi:hypothetical protein